MLIYLDSNMAAEILGGEFDLSPLEGIFSTVKP